MREAKGISALVVAGFAVVALAAFDPREAPADQQSLVGPVGLWLAWALFRAFGYAGFLFPVLLGAWGAGAFLRPSAVRGRLPLLGLAVLLVTATGLLSLAATAERVDHGGLVGWGLDVRRFARRSAPPGPGWCCSPRCRWACCSSPRCRTRRSAASSRPAWRGCAGSAHAHAGAGRDAGHARAERRLRWPCPRSPPMEPAPLPVVVEPSRPRGGLMEKGLAWQETFDFGKGGAESFQLPPVGLLKLPPPRSSKRSREELQDNAETLRRKLQDFEVDGRIVQVSPGPIITSYEFEPAPGVKVSQVVNRADDLALALKAASVRIVGPIPGRGTIAVEVPNAEAATVYLREIFMSAEFAESKGKLPLALGKDVTGTPVVADLTTMPHLLVAGRHRAAASPSVSTR